MTYIIYNNYMYTYSALKGFYDIVTKKEAERRLERSLEEKKKLQKWKDLKYSY